MKNLIVILGPTASGKTAIAITIAQAVDSEIVSADSRQLYREMNIGTAKPGTAELTLIRHHFIDYCSIHQPFTAGQFAREVRLFLDDYFLSHDTIVICGGTGLYVRALLEGMDRKPVSEEIRNEVRRLFNEGGLDSIVAHLINLDSGFASETELANPQRVMRALEWVLAGKPKESGSELPMDWRIKKIGLDLPRPELYGRINRRVDDMIANGLWEEAEALIPFKDLNALQTVGYQEIFESLQGKISRETAISLIKQHTRNYAKRQMTWFRKDKEIEWFNPVNQAAIIEVACAFSQGT